MMAGGFTFMLGRRHDAAGGTITFVGSKGWAHNATSTQSVSLSDLKDESNNNATLLDGDILIVTVNRTENSASSEAAMLCTGFTSMHSPVYANDSNDTCLMAQYKFMGASPDTSITVPASGSTNRGVAGSIHAFRGVSSSAPSDTTPTTASGTGGGVPDAPSITPATAGAVIMACGACAGSSLSALTNPSGMSATTNHFKAGLTTAPIVDAAAGAALYTSWTSGAYDPATFGGGQSGAGQSWAAVTLALRPE